MHAGSTPTLPSCTLASPMSPTRLGGSLSAVQPALLLYSPPAASARPASSHAAPCASLYARVVLPGSKQPWRCALLRQPLPAPARSTPPSLPQPAHLPWRAHTAREGAGAAISVVSAHPRQPRWRHRPRSWSRLRPWRSFRRSTAPVPASTPADGGAAALRRASQDRVLRSSDAL
jgi:hypothetical protein